MIINNIPCSSCISRKSIRKSIPKVKTTMTSSPLQLIHSNVARPFCVRSLGGARYFLTFIDDYCKKTWVYFLSTKDQVLEKFKFFHKEVERITRNKIGTLKIDNGGEYTSKAFYSYCASFGILRQLSQSYPPQHNGVAKRKNRSILDIVRCLLLDGTISSPLWAEAMRAIWILLNLCPSKTSPDKSRDELFPGKKPFISHLRTFGSLVFVHQTKPTRSKLDPCATLHIHLSFNNKTEAYRCYDPTSHKVIVSKNVRFFEHNPFTNLPLLELSSPLQLLILLQTSPLFTYPLVCPLPPTHPYLLLLSSTFPLST